MQRLKTALVAGVTTLAYILVSVTESPESLLTAVLGCVAAAGLLCFFLGFSKLLVLLFLFLSQ